MKTKNHSSHLRLVYSDAHSDHNEEIVLSFDKFSQLELFPNVEIKDLLIFIQPEEIDTFDMLSDYDTKMAATIIDIRELPFLSFNDLSREYFINYLKDNNVNYINIHRFMREFNTDSVSAFFKLINNQLDVDDKKFVSLINVIKNSLSEGPTIVFTDSYPSTDMLASCFTKLLRKLDVSFSPYVCLSDSTIKAKTSLKLMA